MRLKEEHIEAAIVRAWGRALRKEDNEYVVNKPPVGFIRFEGLVLLINNISKPYVPQQYREKAVREFQELRQRKIVLEHDAWFSLDLMSPQNPKGESKADCYRRMCSLAAELLDENCMGVSFPETGHLRPFDAELKRALRSDDPLRQAMRWEKAPALAIEQNDPALVAAVTEARRRWPEFLQAFQGRDESQMFCVKAPFRDGENVEWMWVSVAEIKDQVIEGKVGNDPVDLKNVREGDIVRIPSSTIEDWIYNSGKTTVGGFTTTVIGH